MIVSLRMVWHSNSPLNPTGYGKMTALFVPRIIELGHEIRRHLSALFVRWLPDQLE